MSADMKKKCITIHRVSQNRQVTYSLDGRMDKACGAKSILRIESQTGTRLEGGNWLLNQQHFPRQLKIREEMIRSGEK